MAAPRLFQNDHIESSGSKRSTMSRPGGEVSSRRTTLSSLTPVTNRGAKRRSLVPQQPDRASLENDRRESIFYSTPARVNKKRPSPGPPVIKTRPQLHPQTAALATAASSTTTPSSSLALPSSSSVAGPQQLLRSTPASRLNQGQVGGTSLSAPNPQQLLSQRDSRPLRDRKYQELISAEIHSFLNENRFEMESGIKLSESTLKAPTQKEFIGMFTFLMRIQNPTYKFIKSPDSEIFTALKLMNYPYIDSISRSQIGAVGGQNWPTFLGVLYWLVTRNLKLLRITEGDEVPEDEDRLHDQYHGYITSKYSNFLREQEDGSVERELQEQLDQMKISTIQKTQQYNQDKVIIQQETVQLEADGKIIETAEIKADELFRDFHALKNYIESREATKPKRDEILVNLERATIDEHNLLEQSRREVIELQLQLEQLGISKESVEKLHMDRNHADRAYEIAETQYNELKERSDRVYDQLTREVLGLEETVTRLNFQVQIFDPNFQLSLNKDIDTPIALTVDEILNQRTSEVKNEFVQLKARLTSILEECRKRLSNLTGEREKINHRINMLETKRDEGERRVGDINREYDKKYALMQQKSVEVSLQIESLEKDLKQQDNEAKKQLYELEKFDQEARIKHNNIVIDIENKRKDLEALRAAVVAIALQIQTDTQEALLSVDDNVQEEVAFQQNLRKNSS
ncbi:putative kinetochore protein NDC80 [Spathaspora sp. JA1]|nr:putative kinetochore protein NDC80 [Spathaspora sp. JA1]